MTNTPKPAPATPAATPLREANQQRVDAAVQRVRQAMNYRKYLPDDPFRKDVELLIEIALAPVLEIFAAAQPAATSMDLERLAQVIAHRVCIGEEHDPANGKIHGYCVVCGVPWPCEYAGPKPVPAVAQPQRESEQPEPRT